MIATVVLPVLAVVIGGIIIIAMTRDMDGGTCFEGRYPRRRRRLPSQSSSSPSPSRSELPPAPSRSRSTPPRSDSPTGSSSPSRWSMAARDGREGTELAYFLAGLASRPPNQQSTQLPYARSAGSQSRSAPSSWSQPPSSGAVCDMDVQAWPSRTESPQGAQARSLRSGSGSASSKPSQVSSARAVRNFNVQQPQGRLQQLLTSQSASRRPATQPRRAQRSGLGSTWSPPSQVSSTGAVHNFNIRQSQGPSQQSPLSQPTSWRLATQSQRAQPQYRRSGSGSASSPPSQVSSTGAVHNFSIRQSQWLSQQSPPSQLTSCRLAMQSQRAQPQYRRPGSGSASSRPSQVSSTGAVHNFKMQQPQWPSQQSLPSQGSRCHRGS